jgi:hypothetical protein
LFGVAVNGFKICTFPRALAARGFVYNLVLTSRQYFTFNSFPIIKALVAQPYRGRHDLVLRPFSQGLIVETKPLLYKLCALVGATLQYD